jgi:hypothetical protein
LIVGCGIGNVKPLSKPYFNPKSLWLKRPWNSSIYHHHVLQKEKDVILIIKKYIRPMCGLLDR